MDLTLFLQVTLQYMIIIGTYISEFEHLDA